VPFSSSFEYQIRCFCNRITNSVAAGRSGQGMTTGPGQREGPFAHRLRAFPTCWLRCCSPLGGTTVPGLSRWGWSRHKVYPHPYPGGHRAMKAHPLAATPLGQSLPSGARGDRQKADGQAGMTAARRPQLITNSGPEIGSQQETARRLHDGRRRVCGVREALTRRKRRCRGLRHRCRCPR